MGTKILGLFVVFAAMSTVACSDDKPKTPQQIQAAANACMFDPTGNCQQRAKTIMENPQLAGEINRVGQVAIGNSGTGAVQVRNGVVQPILPASVIQAQALKVQAALTADSNNPRSLHYDPPQATRAPAAAATPAPTSAASLQPASVSSEPAPQMVSGTSLGEVTR